jgi:hypothetical protein
VRSVAALLWLGACWLSLASFALPNDHFGRMSPARQIAIYGDLPFRDYFDPGYFLTELTSAGLMRVLGDNLLGEALLTTVFIATGTLLVFLLAVRLTESVAISLITSVVALLLLPRAYDYDKVLLYPFGLLLCWRYVEQPRVGRLWAFAAGAVIAALFRYDNGIYLTAGMVVALAVVHAGQWRLVLERVGHLVLAVACLALPFLLFIQYQGGLADAIDQMVAYGRREVARTRLPALRFAFDTPGGIASAANADVFLSYLVRLMPLAGVLWLVLDARAGRVSRERTAQLASLVAVCAVLNVFILRAPIGARFGGMAGPVAILSAWITYRTWCDTHSPLRWPRLIVVVLAVITVWGVSASAGWRGRIQVEGVNALNVVRRLERLAISPPSVEDAFNPSIVGLVRYIRECTSPRDRVLATWFAPDLYFYAQRAFAARTVALFGGHWSEPRFEQRSVSALEAQSVPIVLTLTADNNFSQDYPNIAKHIQEQYRLAGTSSFGDPQIEAGGYTVWVRRDRQPARTYADTSLPCF